jgi:hypothetical protein
VEIFQTLKIKSIAFDIEIDRSVLPLNSVLIWATESDGSVLCTLINKDSPAAFKWQYVASDTTMKNVTIGSHLKVYAVSTSGNVLYRYGVNINSHFCGTTWSVLTSSISHSVRYTNKLLF